MVYGAAWRGRRTVTPEPEMGRRVRIPYGPLSSSIIELESMGVMTQRLLYEELSRFAVVRNAVMRDNFSEITGGVQS